MINKETFNKKKWPGFFVSKNLKKLTTNISTKTYEYLYPEKISNNNNNRIFYKIDERWLEKNLKIEEIENSEDLSFEELENIVLEKIIYLEEKWINIDDVDLSKILDKEKKIKEEWKIEVNNTQKNIDKILSDNFPILSVWRIKEDHNIINIRFWWIKKINDNFSKEFTDFLTSQIENEIENNFREKNKTIEPDYRRWRKISSNYKNITLSLPEEFNIARDLFWEKNINTFIKKILDELNDEKLKKLLKNNNLVNYELKKGKGANVFKKVKWLAKKFILNNFYIWVWKTKNESNRFKEKSESMYKSILASKSEIKWYINEWIKKYDFEEIILASKNIIEIKYKLIKENIDNTFSYNNWTNHNIIIKIWEEYEINEILINRIKKDKKVIFNPESIWEWIIENIKEYLKLWNDWFYFLTHRLKENNTENNKNKKDDDKIFTELDNSVKKWIIKKDFFIKNHKWFHTKKYLEKSVKWKKWIKIFIDVIWNWLLNFEKFIEIAEEINKWEIDKNNIDKLLHVCDSTSLKVIRAIKLFLVKNPKSIINIAWDEIFLFIPWKEKWDEDEIIDNLSNELKDENIKARFISSFHNDITFDNLDFLTSINKAFEEKFENNKFWLNKNIILNIYDELKKDILYKKEIIDKWVNENINLFYQINNLELDDFINNKGNKKYEHSYNLIDIEIIKKENSFIINISKNI